MNKNQKDPRFGKLAKDAITGFSGTITGIATYITGCDQLLLQPRVKAEGGDYVDGKWFDDGRIQITDTQNVLAEDVTGEAPGADIPAPVK